MLKIFSTKSNIYILFVAKVGLVSVVAEKKKIIILNTSWGKEMIS